MCISSCLDRNSIKNCDFLFRMIGLEQCPFNDVSILKTPHSTFVIVVSIYLFISMRNDHCYDCVR